MKKKNLLCRTVFGLLPKLYCEKDLYCNIEIVFQEIGEKAMGLFCKEGLK